MTHARTLSASVAALSVAVLACSGGPAATGASRAGAPAEPAAAAPGPSPRPEPEPAAVAALRAEGPAALDRLLAAHDAASGDERERLAALVDRVAAQRYATASRLYWHTDLAAAQAAARADGKPILSLRMLGRLDEDRSCANSRFFRVALYANTELAAFLRDRFVLHWSSERDVPRLTVDFGDGRRIETTIAGNSAHYVLDADGRVIDVIPGLVAAPAFRAVLEQALGLHAHVAAAPDPDTRARVLRDHHAGVVAMIDRQWPRVALTEEGRQASLAWAERQTMMKAYVEMPIVASMLLGPDPQSIPPADPRWAEIGAAVLEQHGGLVIVGLGATERAMPELLDDGSRALIARLAPTDWARPGDRLDAAAVAALIASFERALIADTGLNLTRLRQQVSAMLRDRAAGGASLALADVNAWVYDRLFLTPAADPWLGMATPGVFTGLPGDGVVVAR